jgi:hypothetical protein
MIRNEELLNDQQFLQLNQMRQSDLIAKHCAGIEEHIRTALSRFEAERIAANTCLQFQHECTSALVRNVLTHRVEELMIKHWNQRTEKNK